MGKGNYVLENIDFDKVKFDKNNSGKYILDDKVEGLLPFNDIRVMFEDDFWDLKIKHYKENSKFKFSDIDYNFREYIKSYVLESLINSDSLSTVKKNFAVLKYICKYLHENYIFSTEVITKNIIVQLNEELIKKYTSEGERIRARRLFIKLLNKIESKTGVDYKELKLLLEHTNNSKLRKAQIENGKTKNIDNKIFNKIIEKALIEINDENLDENRKIEACSVLILSQTGMRISDVSTLEADMIREIKGVDNEKTLKYLKFFSHKILKSYTETFLTDICYEAYRKLEELTAIRRSKFNTKYLFINSSGNEVKTVTIEKYIKKFIIRNSEYIGVLNKSFEGNFIFTHEVNKRYNLIKEEHYDFLVGNYFVSIPKAHQFRVAVCNELINQGIDFKWVQKHMGHLTSEMTFHYSRAIKEENDKVIEGIVKKDFKLIGKESERLIQKIEDFIKQGNYNVRTDLDEIVKELSKIVPIRAKKNGYCIKSSFGKKCKYNEYMCAFEICPNHCTSYLFSNISYNRFIEGIKIIEYNNINGFTNEAIMEKNKLKRLVDDYLLKELEELKNEIDKRGKKELISYNKQLEYLCDNIDRVLSEVRGWR